MLCTHLEVIPVTLFFGRWPGFREPFSYAPWGRSLDCFYRSLAWLYSALLHTFHGVVPVIFSLAWPAPVFYSIESDIILFVPFSLKILRRGELKKSLDTMETKCAGLEAAKAKLAKDLEDAKATILDSKDQAVSLFLCELILCGLNLSFSYSFQFTRSHKGDKAPVNNDSASDTDEANLSLMDRTKRQAKAARDQFQQQPTLDAPVEGEVQDLEQMVLQTRERVKAAKAAKLRAASLRRELLDLQEEEQSIAASEDVHPASAPGPVAPDTGAPIATDAGALVAASLNSAVIMSIFVSL